MSQSSTVSATARLDETSPDDAGELEAERSTEEVLATLDDADCRDVLAATSDEALSASEVSKACDPSLSTTYRKLDRLTDAGLLEARARVRRSGGHANEYVRLVDDVVNFSQPETASSSRSLASVLGNRDRPRTRYSPT